MAKALHAVGNHVCYLGKAGAAISGRYDPGELLGPRDLNAHSL
jgi:hypothetical protein